MKKAINERNTCESCKYFSQHYVKYNGEYYPIETGTCMCGELSGIERRNLDIKKDCKFHMSKNK